MFLLYEGITRREPSGKVRMALQQEADTQVTDLHLWRVGRAQFACIVTLKRARHLLFIAITGGEELRAKERQEQIA